MQLPGLLVEYLINGSMALLWVIQLIPILGFKPPANNTFLALFIPGLYVLGLTVDYLGRIIVLPWKQKVKDRAYTQLRGKQLDAHLIQSKLNAYSPALTQAVEMRSSRDRIARGTLFNVLVATVVYLVLNIPTGQARLPVIVLGVILLLVSFAMWRRYQYLSYDYEIKAYLALEEMLARAEKLPNDADRPGAL